MPVNHLAPPSANALTSMGMQGAAQIPGGIEKLTNYIFSLPRETARAVYQNLSPQVQASLVQAANASAQVAQQVQRGIAASPTGQAIGAGLQGLDMATKPLQENYAANQQMMKDMGVQAPSMVDNPLFDVADVGPIGSAGSTILYRGRQIGQNEAGKATWWTPSEEMATKFSQHVRGKKKPVTTGEVVSETLGPDVKVADTGRDVVSYPTYAEVSKELGVPYEELEDAIKKAPDHSNASVIAPDIAPDKQVRFHFLIEIPEVQDLLRSKGFTHIKAKERISKDEYVPTYLNFSKKANAVNK